MLAGVGVPDIRGGQGTGTFYTQDKTAVAKENEQLVHLDSGTDVKTRIIGPRNTRTNPPSDVGEEIRVAVEHASSSLHIENSGASINLQVPAKSWSPWVRVKFKLSMLQSMSGIVRFYVRQLTPHIEFYVSPVNFDPAAPLFPISSPADYAKQLSQSIGLFSTLGMAEDHNGHNNGRFDEQDYIADCDLVFEEREKMMNFELARFTEGLFFVLFDTPDRFQHMFWRFRDPSHPYYDPELAKQLGPQVDNLYRRCDSLLGSVLEKIDENTLLIVLSDHGFNSFRRAVDTNTWLWQNNLLALKDGKKPSDLEGISAGVDWSHTSAYAVGLGGIYLNMKGREGAGILEEGAEAERVRRAIEQGMPQLKDPESEGQPAIRSVSRREGIYSGPYVSDAPDMLVNFSPGYRVSWQSAMGGFSTNLLENNTRRWSGDHIIDPEAVPGILFTNRPALHEGASIVDLAPTILEHLKVAADPAMEGKSLLTV
jgi:predicted AlkP superfamily phosphohydrolase/phosphomutase